MGGAMGALGGAVDAQVIGQFGPRHKVSEDAPPEARWLHRLNGL
ncbi:hypothetical protein ACSSVY_004476 [Roseovarius sp. MBR-51]